MSDFVFGFLIGVLCVLLGLGVGIWIFFRPRPDDDIHDIYD